TTEALMLTHEQAAQGAARLAVCKGYPNDPIVRAEVADMLMEMVEHPDQLEWLLKTMRDCVGDWPGPRELRAVYSYKFRPLDGNEAWSALPGFTAADSEREFLKEISDNGRGALEPTRDGRGLKQITGTSKIGGHDV